MDDGRIIHEDEPEVTGQYEESILASAREETSVNFLAEPVQPTRRTRISGSERQRNSPRFEKTLLIQ